MRASKFNQKNSKLFWAYKQNATESNILRTDGHKNFNFAEFIFANAIFKRSFAEFLITIEVLLGIYSLECWFG